MIFLHTSIYYCAEGLGPWGYFKLNRLICSLDINTKTYFHNIIKNNKVLYSDILTYHIKKNRFPM